MRDICRVAAGRFLPRADASFAMGVPNPDFSSRRPLTEAEAAMLAHAALARARASLAHGRRSAAPARAEPAHALAPFAEGLIILGSGLACLLVWLVSHA